MTQRRAAGTARGDVLARIRAAVAGEPAALPPADPPAYRVRGEMSAVELTDLLADRLAHYRARVRCVPPEMLATEVADGLAAREAERVVVPPGLDLPLPDSVDVTVDDGLTAGELGAFDAVITRAAVAIAETGTIILDGSAGQGRRAISLVPDYHLCIVERGQVVQLVPEALTACPACTYSAAIGASYESATACSPEEPSRARISSASGAPSWVYSVSAWRQWSRAWSCSSAKWWLSARSRWTPACW